MYNKDTDDQVTNLIFEANITALLYVISEQRALIGKLMEQLIRSGALKSSELEKATEIYSEPDMVEPVYAEVYQRYAQYYIGLKELLDSKRDEE